jgi:hypothetical protein
LSPMSIIASESFVITFTFKLHPEDFHKSLFNFSNFSESSSSESRSDFSRFRVTA